MMKKKGHAAATAEPTPVSTQTPELDQSEREFNRMISQHMTYHRMMMDDLMKLSSGSESSDQLPNVVSGLGTTVANIDESNQQLQQSAAKYAEQGKQSAATVSNLNAFMRSNSSKLNNDIKAYTAIAQKEGFTSSNGAHPNPNNNNNNNNNNHDPNTPNPNPTMDAALETSAIVRESQKYALVILGLSAMYLLYKTIKKL
jgi:DNA segregation ATPase FtsK/SpoIIIE-like protein